MINLSLTNVKLLEFESLRVFQALFKPKYLVNS